jgi:hypothetical protein
VIDWYSNGGANQDWLFVPEANSNTTYEIVNVNSNMCLTTDGVAGDQVYQDYCTNSTNQQWGTALTQGNPTDYWHIQSVYSGLYLDVSGDSPWPGASIDTWYDNGGDNRGRVRTRPVRARLRLSGAKGSVKSETDARPVVLPRLHMGRLR